MAEQIYMNEMINQQQENGGVNRRDFLKGGSFATLMTMLGGVRLFAQSTPESETKVEIEVKKIKVGLIGLGLWGREILDQLGRVEHAEIVAICDNYPAMLRRSASKAPNAMQTEDYKALIANKDVEAVIVATPTHLHKDIVIEALKAGKHVYCEMPLAHTIEDARAIAMAAKNTPAKFFQSGLQLRCDPQRHWLTPFIRSGALGKPMLARSQWHKKTSWRSSSPNAEREKAVNWRLSKETSLGLAGEIGIHQIDQAGWLFLDAAPEAITGFGSINLWNDGRDVADTIQVVVEYPGGVRLIHDCTLGNSFDADYEIYSGSYAAVLVRDLPLSAWMFKEVDSPLLGWEVYARRDAFHKETGIALVAGASKQTALSESGAAASAFPNPPLFYALEAFLIRCGETDETVADFKANFGTDDPQALAEFLATAVRPSGGEVSPTSAARENVRRMAPRHDVGYAATVLAIKANEAVTQRTRIELKKEWFELA